MKTLTEFRSHFQPMVVAQSRDIATKIEAGGSMSRFLLLEPKLRSEVDSRVRDYAESLSVQQSNLQSLEVGYLFHLRLLHAAELAQFLDLCGLGSPQMTAKEWIQFLAIDSWHEITVHKWRFEFLKVYGEP